MFKDNVFGDNKSKNLETHDNKYILIPFLILVLNVKSFCKIKFND